jgi:hypothetical protein
MAYSLEIVEWPSVMKLHCSAQHIRNRRKLSRNTDTDFGKLTITIYDLLAILMFAIGTVHMSMPYHFNI